MGGNVSKEGAHLDVGWMHRVGLGGFQAFEGWMFTPNVVPHPIGYMTMVVLRFGYSLNGAQNLPAPEDATGLEVDKLDHAAVRAYEEHYLDLFKSAVGSDLMGVHGLHYVVNDSWEAGNQN